MTCTRCDGTGFLNSEQFPMDVLDAGFDTMLAWTKIDVGQASDVAICDCCGDGEAGWHGLPGEHYTSDDPIGKNGPYAGNGGLCRCH